MNKKFQAQQGQNELQMISLDGLMARIRARLSGNFDMVIGIVRGGILPAYLASRWLDVPLKTTGMLDGNHLAQGRQPHLESSRITGGGMRVLLVDDVAKTGATLRRAARELEGADITTMVISGEADISLFGPHEKCIRWPWDK